MRPLTTSVMALALTASLAGSPLTARAFDLEDYATTYRATRDAWLKASNELKLAGNAYRMTRLALTVMGFDLTQAEALFYPAVDNFRPVIEDRVGRPCAGADGQPDPLLCNRDSLCLDDGGTLRCGPRDQDLASRYAAVDYRDLARWLPEALNLIGDVLSPNIDPGTLIYGGAQGDLSKVLAAFEDTSFSYYRAERDHTLRGLSARIVASYPDFAPRPADDPDYPNLVVPTHLATAECPTDPFMHQDMYEDAMTYYRATRDAYLKAANELRLATGPYHAARDAYRAATDTYVFETQCQDMATSDPAPFLFCGEEGAVGSGLFRCDCTGGDGNCAVNGPALVVNRPVPNLSFWLCPADLASTDHCGCVRDGTDRPCDDTSPLFQFD